MTALLHHSWFVLNVVSKGMMEHSWNPSFSGVLKQKDLEFESSLGYIKRSCLKELQISGLERRLRG